MSGTGRPPAATAAPAAPRRSVPRRLAGGLATAVGGLLALLSLVLGIAAAVPGAGLFSALGALLLPTYGPWLVVGALVATGLGLWRRRRGPRRTATLVTAAGAVAVVLDVVLVTVFIVQVSAAGGSIDPLRALAVAAEDGPPDATTSYSTPDGRRFPVDVWRPARTTARTPVIFYVHGGGWVAGDPSGNGAQLRWFADHGWLVVSVGYELATATSATWDRAPRQVACALAWAGRTVGRYGGDPSRLVVAGDSAGGNLAVNLAYGAADGSVRTRCGPLPDVRGVAVQYPAVDPVEIWDDGFGVSGSPGASARIFLKWYVGGSPARHPDRYRAISSTSFVNAKAPPTLVISPDRDSLVPPPGVRAFVRRAAAAGIDTTRVDIPFANHAYDVDHARTLGGQARLSITQHWLREQVGR